MVKTPHSHVSVAAPLEQGSALLDRSEVATVCRCSVRQVERLVEQGIMPAPIRLGSLVRWQRAVIEPWIAGGCRAVRSVAQEATHG